MLSNVTLPFVEEQVLVHIEESQQPQVEVLLHRYTREARFAILDNYASIFKEHEFDIRLEDDPSFIGQAKQNAIPKVNWCHEGRGKIGEIQ